MAGVTVRKLSISVPPEVEETIKAAAAEEGKPVSAWLAEAATEKAHAAALHAAGRAAACELVTEYENEHGPLPAESRRRAHQFLIETGLIDDEPQRAAVPRTGPLRRCRCRRAPCPIRPRQGQQRGLLVADILGLPSSDRARLGACGLLPCKHGTVSTTPNTEEQAALAASVRGGDVQ
jgi:hypothetical protein